MIILQAGAISAMKNYAAPVKAQELPPKSRDRWSRKYRDQIKIVAGNSR
jgi:hypothetical protein